MKTTVKELIAKLQKFNQDLPVLLDPCIDPNGDVDINDGITLFQEEDWENEDEENRKQFVAISSPALKHGCPVDIFPGDELPAANVYSTDEDDDAD